MPWDSNSDGLSGGRLSLVQGALGGDGVAHRTSPLSVETIVGEEQMNNISLTVFLSS